MNTRTSSGCHCSRRLRRAAVPYTLGIHVTLAFAPLATAQPASFQDLGVLSGQTASAARALSADGSIVIGTSGSSGFRWDAQSVQMQDLGFLSGTTTNTPVAVAASGTRIIGRCGARGYYWDQTGMVDLGLAPGQTSNAPAAISGDGTVIAGTSGTRIYTWTLSGLVAYTPPDDRAMAVRATSHDGSAVLVACTGPHSPYSLFRIRAGQMDTLPGLPGGQLGAFGGVISADGQTVAARVAAGNGSPLAIWNGAGIISTPLPGTFPGTPAAMSADATVIAGNIPGTSAFVLSNGTLQTFTAPNQVQFTALSADGQVALGTARRGSPLTTEPIILVNNQVLWLKDELQSRGADLTGWTLSTTVFLSRDGTTYTGTATGPPGSHGYRAVLPR